MRVYQGDVVAGAPTWHDQLWLPCKAIAHEWVLAAGDAHTLSYMVRAVEVLGDRGPFDQRPLPPPGEFAVEAVVTLRQPAVTVVRQVGIARFE